MPQVDIPKDQVELVLLAQEFPQKIPHHKSNELSNLKRPELIFVQKESKKQVKNKNTSNLSMML